MKTTFRAIGKNAREARLNVWKNCLLYNIVEVGRAKKIGFGVWDFEVIVNNLVGGFE